MLGLIVGSALNVADATAFNIVVTSDRDGRIGAICLSGVVAAGGAGASVDGMIRVTRMDTGGVKLMHNPANVEVPWSSVVNREGHGWDADIDFGELAGGLPVVKGQNVLSISGVNRSGAATDIFAVVVLR